jgi:formate dehydrogenase major subunit
MLHVTIDGRRATCPDGSTVLDAARRLCVEIPTLCHDDRLAPSGACRLCLVEVAGASKPVAACAAVIHDGMEIRTTSPALEAARQTVLHLLASEYPAAAVAHSPEKPFHRLLAERGVAAEASGPLAGIADESHPYIRVDMSRCIDCYRCVRICDEVQGQNVWHLRDRGVDTIIRPAGDNLLMSPCVGCGACVDTCPSGALEDRSLFDHGQATSWTRSICPYCGVGCELDYGTRAGRIVTARPVLDAPANRGHACVKGRYAFDFVDAPDRVAVPQLRTGTSWRPASWNEAIDVVAGGLRRVIDRYGPDAVGVLGSARATNEENYLTQKFARVVIGTNNVDCCARVCHAPSAAALKAMLGTGAATNGFDDIDEARTIFVVGANPTENHPVVGARIRRAARRGARLIVVDPRRTELAAEPGALHLALRPGSNVPLLNAMAQTVLAEGLVDPVFLEERVDRLAEFREFISGWTPERAAPICGVPADEIRRAARLYATGAPAMIVHGLGITEHVQGTDGVSALVNLALLTGNLGRPGAGVNPLRGQNNVQGAAQMGCDPTTLTGGVALDTARDRFEAIWGRPVPHRRGLKLLEMMDAALAGRLKALIVIGYDIALTNPGEAHTRRALESLDLLVVQDLFRTETAALAHVFLPAQSTFEKDGTFMNAERRIQRVRQVVAPRGEARSDARILCDLASALGAGGAFQYRDAEDIWDEIRTLWPDVAGMSYGRLDVRGLQWPCRSEAHPGTSRLYEQGFPGGRAALRCIDHQPTDERVTGDFPFLLTTGRTLYQFNAGTMTARTKDQELRPADTLDLCSSDAAKLGVSEGQAVRVTSRHGETILPVRVTDAVQAGVVFATFHTAAAFVNRVTSQVRDPVGTPEYKITAVRLEPVGR